MMSSADEKGFGDNIVGLVEKFFELRSLRHLSNEQKEALREELDYVRRVIRDQRPPRVAVVGNYDFPLGDLVETIVGEEEFEAAEDALEIKERLGHNRWYDYETSRGILRLLDVRSEPGEPVATRAIERARPDVVIFAWAEATDEERPETIAELEEVVAAASVDGESPPIIGLLDRARLPEGVGLGEASRILRRQLLASDVPYDKCELVGIEDQHDVMTRLMAAMPLEARLPMARLDWSPETKRQQAKAVIHTCAGLAATLATIPIPVADVVPITAVQVLMVGAISHLAGRRATLKAVGEFALALGLNVGVGLAFREFVRALARVVPFAGSVISSGIAAAATFAIGQAAVTYFIDEGEIDW